jgi:hypothetical protein
VHHATLRPIYIHLEGRLPTTSTRASIKASGALPQGQNCVSRLCKIASPEAILSAIRQQRNSGSVGEI